MRTKHQATLFGAGTAIPPGFVYRPDFLTTEEEAELLGFFEDLPLEHPYTDGYPAKRRVMNFGWKFDIEHARAIPGAPLPPFLRPLQRKVAKWLDIPAARVVEALITEYPHGAAIGWHRDNEPVESIIGVSLGSWCTLRLRPTGSRLRGRTRRARDIAEFSLAPRSAYLMQGDARWNYQHSVPPVAGLRYSITFRTLPR